MLSDQENMVKTQNRVEVKLHKKRQRLILKIRESSPNSFMVCMTIYLWQPREKQSKIKLIGCHARNSVSSTF